MSWLGRLAGFLAPRREADGQPPAPPPAPPAVPVVAVGERAPAGLTSRDLERLRGVHPDLVRVVTRARSLTPFLVAEGVRTVERQRQLVAEGKSRTMASRHITGHAVDLYPISATPIPQMRMEDYRGVVEAMRRAAAAEGVPIVCGYDWGWDAPHYELPRAVYPG